MAHCVTGAAAAAAARPHLVAPPAPRQRRFRLGRFKPALSIPGTWVVLAGTDPVRPSRCRCAAAVQQVQAQEVERQQSGGAAHAPNTRVAERYKPFLDGWDTGFVDTQEVPQGYWLECVQGAVPRDLCGTLFRWAAKARW